MNHKSSKSTEQNLVRLDKWLWAARFFKTRALARSMIENNKVKYNQQRCKPSRSVEVGAVLSIQLGYDEKTVEVLALSEQRKSASEAQLLYSETADSVKKRTEQAEIRKLNYTLNPHPDTKPDKKQRRQLIQVKQKID